MAAAHAGSRLPRRRFSLPVEIDAVAQRRSVARPVPGIAWSGDRDEFPLVSIRKQRELQHSERAQSHFAVRMDGDELI